jgi:hypothetical protein
VRTALLLGLLPLISGCVLEDDGPDVWASGSAITAGGGPESEPDFTACRNALVPELVALVEGRDDCQNPWVPLCYSDEFDDGAAGTVCCDEAEVGAECEIHESGQPVEPCAEGHVRICDF